jgi:hypothetical protein
MAHLIRARFTIEEVLPRLDGWQTNFGLGYQQFLFYGPGFTWAVALVHFLSFGLLSISGAFKVAAFASFIALPISAAFLARSFGLDRSAAGVASILVLCVSSPFGGVGLHGTFGIGLIPNQLGAVFTLVALGGILRIVTDSRAQWVLLTSTALAALLVTHAISAIILAVLLAVIVPTFLATDWLTIAAGRRLLATFVLTGGLAAFWLVPFFAHNNLRGPLTSWTNPPLAERLGQLLAGELLFRPLMVWAVFAGWLFMVGRVHGSQRWALALVLTPLAFLWVADLLLRWDSANVVSLQLTNRGLGYVGVLAVLPLASLLGHFADRLGRRATAGLAVVGCAAVLVVASGLPMRSVARAQTPTPALRALAAQLAAYVPADGRFATQRDWPQELVTAGVPHPDFWLSWASRRDTLNIFNIESSITVGPVLLPNQITQEPADVAADKLTRLGVTHVALINESTARTLESSPRFTLVWRWPPMALLALSPQPTDTAEIAVQAAHKSLNHLAFTVHARGPVEAHLPVAWSPKWHARVDGQPVQAARTDEGLLMVPLSAGRSRVELVFRSDRWDTLGVGLTVLTLVVLAGWRLEPFRRWLRRAFKGSWGLA